MLNVVLVVMHVGGHKDDVGQEQEQEEQEDTAEGYATPVHTRDSLRFKCSFCIPIKNRAWQLC